MKISRVRLVGIGNPRPSSSGRAGACRGSERGERVEGMKWIGLLVVALLSCLTFACGDATPATPSPSVSGLTVTGTDLVRIGGSERFSAAATLSGGAVETVSPSWSTSNQAVVTVDASGMVTGVASGQATITATYQGRTASQAVRVVPDYAGRWSGAWTVSNCQVQGAFRPDWCAAVQGSFPAALDLQQSRDVVSGTWTLQEANGTVQGTIAADGALSLAGTSLQSGVQIEVSSWRSVSTDNRTMTGSFTLTWRAAGVNGSAQTTVDLRNFTKQ